MPNHTPKSDIPSYLRFLQLVDNFDRMGISKELNADEEKILDRVTFSTLKGQQVMVGDILALSHLGSQATLHGRIKNLVAKGFLDLKIDDKDRRHKFLIPTKRTIKHYDALSKALTKAIGNT